MNISEVLQIVMTLLLILSVESILSFDNVAVIALLVNKNLPLQDRQKALRYGIVGAFIFRGLCLFFVSWIMNNPSVGAIFKIVGGLYLFRLGYKGLTPAADSTEEGEVGWADRLLKKLGIGIFWSTVIVVEMVDIVFSLDNLVAVVSLSDKFWVVVVGVCLGIVTMRFVAGVFLKLMQKYPSLERSAFIVILILGIKLFVSGVADYAPFMAGIKHAMETHLFDFLFSGIMMLIFFLPIIIKKKKIYSQPTN